MLEVEVGRSSQRLGVEVLRLESKTERWRKPGRVKG
jgi:hypothetical protein